jgi:hypothetical protein
MTDSRESASSAGQPPIVAASVLQTMMVEALGRRLAMAAALRREEQEALARARQPAFRSGVPAEAGPPLLPCSCPVSTSATL